MCQECKKEIEEKRIDLTEEEIDNIIVERYNDKDEKTKVFIKKALKIHGDKFDYYKTEYINAKAKVIVTCREDGEFEVISSNHLRVFCSGGCNSCANRNRANIKKLTTEEFIDRSKKVHGDKYDYSEVNYINNCTKVIINCPEHGSFSQLPIVHLSGGGCPSCSGNKKYTTESFIEEAKKVHGDKYDYSKVDYINANTEVIIGCPKHGLFSQLPLVHLKHECPKCGSEEISRKLTKTTEQFIKEAKEIHGDKYNYDKVNYIGCKEDVIITCLEHGDFKTTPDYHLQGKGCPKCREEEKKNSVSKLSKGVDQFIIDARKIHGNKYEYSKVNYTNAYTNVEIICPVHGSFWQTPHNHLHGRGCSDCNNSIRL